MSDVKDLNSQQLEATRHDKGPLLIIAGAGTGKTTVITERIKHLITNQNVPPSNILALTFTEKAATEMETRIDEVMPYGAVQMWIETFHAFCDRILRNEALHIGLNPTFKLMTEAESLLFLRKNLFKFDLNYFRPLGNPTKFLQGMLTHFSRLKDDDIKPDEYLKYSEKLYPSRSTLNPEQKEELGKTLELAQAFKIYEELKTKEAVMDFSDLISNTLNLFRKRTNILLRYQKQFQYILVDEFQDTNYAQNELAILLSGTDKNITVVGDDDQSIYRWRGAAVANMMQFKKHFPDAKIITLTKNYRSTQNILDSTYKLIQNNNPDRLEIKEKIDKKLISMRERRGENIEFIYENKAVDEAEKVVEKIREKIDLSAHKTGKTNRSYKDFAILVRANDHSLPFQKALERAHIPFQFLGPGRLFQQDEIKDLIAYLRALSNFEDNSSLYRVIAHPVFDIQARDIAAALNHAKKNSTSLFEAMEDVESSKLTSSGIEKIKKITKMMKNHLEKVPKIDAGQILYYFFTDSGLLGHYLDPGSKRTEKEAQNIAKFFEKLQNYTSNHDDSSVFAVVDWINLSMELGESPLATDIDWSENNAVNILTIHSSKGLEFPYVFVVNLVRDRFPSRNRREQIPVPTDLIREELPEGDENLQEERRLFYVAATRAKDKLFLSAAKFYGDGKRIRKISPFVPEILGEEMIESIVKKQTEKTSNQQLTLLDIVNSQIQNEESKSELTTNNQEPRTNINYISYSQIQTFLTCPLHYKLRYVLGIPTPPTPALSYGVSVHSTLKEFSESLSANQKPDIIKLLKKNWIKEGYSGRSHEEKSFIQAKKMLTNFARENTDKKSSTIGIETPFSFWLERLDKGASKLKLGGRIDRIDKLPNGKIEIVDYKTGKNIPTEKKLKEDLQLSFYALAATTVKDEIFNKKPEEIILSLYYLEEGKKLSTTRTTKDLFDARQKILEIVNDISTSEFHCNKSMFCKNCEYQMVCSA